MRFPLKEIFEKYYEGIFFATTWIGIFLICAFFWAWVFNFVRGLI